MLPPPSPDVRNPIGNTLALTEDRRHVALCLGSITLRCVSPRIFVDIAIKGLMAIMNESDIQNLVKQIPDPILESPLGKLKMIQQVVLENKTVQVVVELPTPAYPQREQLKSLITDKIKTAYPEVESVEVKFNVVVRGKKSGARIGLRAKNVIAVGSGKGGVGKSTVAASLAFGLKHLGAKVGLLDADVYGPSIPHMAGVKGQPGVLEYTTSEGQTIQRIEPLDADGLKLMSIGFMIEEEQAVIWRGPMLHKILTQFVQQTEWGDLDYLIIDMPPGTGDVSLTLSQMLGLAGAVVVCTPQQVALLDAVKAISMFNQVKIPVLGMVENMSGEIFGQGGVEKRAAEMKVPFLGEIPIDATFRIKGDAGSISSLFDDDSPVRDSLLRITENIAMEIVRNLQDEPDMPQLEIL
ncbi:Flagellum site-determining protein YlxH [Polystyrenella longa]|uniref:Iron-sulfur cluster carrier protein n=1 Tax=Polystyrenella longa TaxID=2528007 RepID=A0A518CJI9_9PLAN|nr:Mrp/NBP35 family ATP-binding protein [Polystyrenella longa]QDU79367.1 Flagellum site-determining protein YlxH [Polystyrenella longa]